MDMVRSGYIGSLEKTTNDFKILIDRILVGDRAVVAAIRDSMTDAKK